MIRRPRDSLTHLDWDKFQSFLESSLRHQAFTIITVRLQSPSETLQVRESWCQDSMPSCGLADKFIVCALAGRQVRVDPVGNLPTTRLGNHENKKPSWSWLIWKLFSPRSPSNEAPFLEIENVLFLHGRPHHVAYGMMPCVFEGSPQSGSCDSFCY